MTIRMFCDHCGEEIAAEVNGGVRVRTGKREIAFHLCAAHQVVLREFINDFCKRGSAREVPPSLPGRL